MPTSQLHPDSCFALAHPRIIHESVSATDALVIDLDLGVYYDMRDVACTIWKSALRGLPLAAIAAEIERCHLDCRGDLHQVAGAFVQSLLDAGLLAPSVRAEPAAGEVVAGSAPTPYRAPSLERYTDLEDLLRADPIHEVVDPEGV